MTRRHPFAAIAFLAGALGGCPMSEQRITANGAWADDNSAVLLVESRYLTPDPSQPYWGDLSSRDWQFAFVQADPSLQGRTELAHFPDLSPEGGGGIQYAPVYWLRSRGKVVASQYHQVFIFDLASSTATPLWLPQDVALQLYGDFAGSGLDPDHPEAGLVMGYVPSPTSATVGVFYTLAYDGPGGLFDPRYAHAIAFFGLDGSFISATRLQTWFDTGEQLRLTPPHVGPPPPVPPYPPGVILDEPLLGEIFFYFLWTQDGSAAVVVDVDRDGQGAFLSSSRAERVEVADGGTSEVTLVPSLALPTRGGSVSDTGQYLQRVNPTAHPNEVSIQLGAQPSWTAFGDVPLVTLDQIDYAL